MQRIGSRGGIVAQDGKVGGDLAVEQGKLLQFGARELAEAAGVRLREQGGEPVPVRAALLNPLVGENVGHGPGFRSA